MASRQCSGTPAWTVRPDDVAEGDRIFASHSEFMTGHSRNGDTALLSYLRLSRKLGVVRRV